MCLEAEGKRLEERLRELVKRTKEALEPFNREKALMLLDEIEGEYEKAVESGFYGIAWLLLDLKETLESALWSRGEWLN